MNEMDKQEGFPIILLHDTAWQYRDGSWNARPMGKTGS
jgi:hypothetical protein